jgi:uncharacterized protein YwgA
MSNTLNQIYSLIFQEPFCYTDFDKRKKLQKAVYILENMGVSIGDYSFSWDSYGPYSLSLDCDASLPVKEGSKDVAFSEYAKDCFSQLKAYVEQNNNYACTEWLECIASLHYLKTIYRIDNNAVIQALTNRKPYLNKSADNLKALEIANLIAVSV